MLTRIVNWLWPTQCLVCGFETSVALCPTCLAELPWLHNSCLTCAREFYNCVDSQQCGECLIVPPPINLAVVLFRYQNPIDSLITRLKFQKKLLYAVTLGELLADKIKHFYKERGFDLPECIIPVPLSSKRLRERGYNQAMEIIRPIRKRLGVAIDYKAIKRIKDTRPQTLVSAEERSKNVRGVFAVANPFEYKHVAIADDVVTTFSTLFELARTLRQHGVIKVDAWCVARVH